jgi:hypothetical protein
LTFPQYHILPFATNTKLHIFLTSYFMAKQRLSGILTTEQIFLRSYEHRRLHLRVAVPGMSDFFGDPFPSSRAQNGGDSTGDDHTAMRMLI